VNSIAWRAAEPTDAAAVAKVIADWRPGRHLVHASCPQLFEHFGGTWVIAQKDGSLVGFPQEPSDEIVGGLPVHHDATGVGFDFIVMVERLDREAR
jgi:hypothetical protein